MTSALERLEQRLAHLGNERAVLIGLPNDENSSHLRGAASGPPAVREALFSEAGNLWTENGTDLGAEDGLFDAGEIGSHDAQPTLETIHAGLAMILDRGRVPISVGGDHAVTQAIVRAVHAHHGPCCLVQFDAHPDLYDDFEGNATSHASVFARIMEQGLARRLVQIGIRTMNGDQREQAERFGVEVIEMRDWSRASELTLDDPVYVSLDLDVLEPGSAPGLSHREPGGATPRQIIDLLASMRSPLIGADVVECNPSLDPSGLTAQVAAKLVKQLTQWALTDGVRL